MANQLLLIQSLSWSTSKTLNKWTNTNSLQLIRISSACLLVQASLLNFNKIQKKKEGNDQGKWLLLWTTCISPSQVLNLDWCPAPCLHSWKMTAVPACSHGSEPANGHGALHYVSQRTLLQYSKWIGKAKCDVTWSLPLAKMLLLMSKQRLRALLCSMCHVLLYRANKCTARHEICILGPHFSTKKWEQWIQQRFRRISSETLTTAVPGNCTDLTEVDCSTTNVAPSCLFSSYNLHLYC